MIGIILMISESQKARGPFPCEVRGNSDDDARCGIWGYGDMVETGILTVKRPRDTVPTNFRTETFLDAIVSDK